MRTSAVEGREPKHGGLSVIIGVVFDVEVELGAVVLVDLVLSADEPVRVHVLGLLQIVLVDGLLDEVAELVEPKLLLELRLREQLADVD